MIVKLISRYLFRYVIVSIEILFVARTRTSPSTTNWRFWRNFQHASLEAYNRGSHWSTPHSLLVNSLHPLLGVVTLIMPNTPANYPLTRHTYYSLRFEFRDVWFSLLWLYNATALDWNFFILKFRLEVHVRIKTTLYTNIQQLKFEMFYF